MSTENQPFCMDALESRTLLSHGFAHFPAAIFGGFGDAHVHCHSHLLNTIQFNQAPAAVQKGLGDLAIARGLTPPAPDSTQTVFLNNVNGIETFTIDLFSTGTKTELTVDQNGKPFTRPTKSSTTWGVLSGTGAGSNTAAAAEISLIATALKLVAPVASTTVKVVTAADGTSTYTIRLNASTAKYARSVEISVDFNGNPVGNQDIPFSTLPKAIQDGINANLPTGSTLAATSTQNVKVRTANGVTSYSVTVSSAGTETTVTVDITGALHNRPSRTKVQFQNIPKPAQDEIQALAKADGFVGTISPTQNVLAYNEGNGTTIYAVTLSVPKTGKHGKAHNFNITVASDQLGNPTVPPSPGWGHRGGFGWHWGWF